MSHKHISTVLFALSALMFACSDEGAGGSRQGGDENDPACTGDNCGTKPGQDKTQKCGDAICLENEVCSAGKCMTPAKPGEECDAQHPCPNGYTCNPKTKTCMVAAGVNESCDGDDHYCKVGTCQNGKCSIVSEEDQLKSADSDGDTIADYYEMGIDDGYSKDAPRDSDNDTIPDYLSLDSNSDGIPDFMKAGTEGDITNAPNDEDGDTIPDYRDNDSDANGISDTAEAPYLVDQNGHHYSVRITAEGDTQKVEIVDSNGNVVGARVDPVTGAVTDAEGNVVSGLKLSYPDTDGDTTPDWLDQDNDGDAVGDLSEIRGVDAMDDAGHMHPGRKCDVDGTVDWCAYGDAEKPWDSDEDGIPDYMDFDSDNDTIPDSIEYTSDTDKDGVLDRYSADSDGDGVPDTGEVAKNKNGYYELVGADGYSSVTDSEGRKLVESSDGMLYVTTNEGDIIECERGIFLAVDKNSGEYYGATSMGNNMGAVSTADGVGALLYNGDCSLRTDDNGHYLAVDADGNIYAVDTETKQVITDDSGVGVIIGKIGENGVISFHTPMYACDDKDCIYKVYCYKSTDCDRDSLPDAQEVWCGNVWSGMTDNVDGDDYLDASEWAAANSAKGQHIQVKEETSCGVETVVKDYTVSEVSDLMCDNTRGVKDIYDFYFELPPAQIENGTTTDAETKDDILVFIPKVSSLDVVFNMDTTGSMGGEIGNLQSSIKGIIDSVNNLVDGSEFAITKFDDFNASCGSYGSGGDVPYRLITAMTKEKSALQTGVNSLSASGGNDEPESDFQSLWQIIMGDNKNWSLTSWNGNSTQYYTPSSDRWGGVNFRNGTLPVIANITDANMHNNVLNKTIPGTSQTTRDVVCSGTSASKTYCKANEAYDSCISNPYTGADVVWAAKQKDARVITVVSGSGGLQQSYDLSEATNAIVPVCAFKNNAGSWICGQNKCCTGSGGTAQDPATGNKCVLRYQISANGSGLGDTLVNGIEALVKYGTYSVSTRTEGFPIKDNTHDTSCFIKRVEAYQYVPPCQDPEASCNPTATPSHVVASDYNDGFANFAPGTSSQNRPGAKLHFKVFAQNDDGTGNPCVPQTESTQSFKAEIHVINPITGLDFGTREVSIIVPGKVQHIDVN